VLASAVGAAAAALARPLLLLLLLFSLLVVRPSRRGLFLPVPLPFLRTSRFYLLVDESWL